MNYSTDYICVRDHLKENILNVLHFTLKVLLSCQLSCIKNKHLLFNIFYLFFSHMEFYFIC